LTAELFQTRTGTKLVHVPYKGTAPALNDLVAGHVDVFFNELATTIAHHRAGKLRILAVTTPERSPQMPEIPTLAELGLAGFVSDTWNAISAPPKTPAAIVAKLNAAIVEGLKSEETIAHLTKMNVQPMTLNPQDAAAFVAADTRRWADVIRAANIAPE
jgi:tripartite-type tricarboxylate transporter receptor subunit TctC